MLATIQLFPSTKRSFDCAGKAVRRQ